MRINRYGAEFWFSMALGLAMYNIMWPTAFFQNTMGAFQSNLTELLPRIDDDDVGSVGSELSVIVLVLSARNDVERRQAIRETWALEHDNVVFIVGDQACGVPPQFRTTPWSCITKGSVPIEEQKKHNISIALEDSALIAEADEHHDLKLVQMIDFYRALPRKLKEAYRWALDHTDAHWMLKIDDDAVARVDQLHELITDGDMVVRGFIRRNNKVPRSGKWAEDPTFISSIYPTFANGAQGHLVTRSVAQAVVQHNGYEYQGEDVSLGIWLHEMSLPVKWVHDTKHFASHGDCHQQQLIVIGHDITPKKMRECFHVLHHTMIGRLGNQLFQWASTVGIAERNDMTLCIHGGDIHSFFDGVGSECTSHPPVRKVGESGKYATSVDFSLGSQDIELEGYLQSYHYFPPNIHKRIQFKQHIIDEAQAFLKLYASRTTVGIHIRRGDLLTYGYMQFPPDGYFINVLQHFRSQYPDVLFVVCSDSTKWCTQQIFFQADDVVIVTEKHAPVVDMAILARCDHHILSTGTFGWWSAFLGRKGGETLYYDNEFIMDHPINKGNVILGDYYPEGWVAFSVEPVHFNNPLPTSTNSVQKGEVLLKPTKWETHLPPTRTDPDWHPTGEGAAFVDSLYTKVSERYKASCANIERIGGKGDGSKLICSSDISTNHCVVYSLGSRLDFKFEQEILSEFGCEIHIFDCTIGTPRTNQVPDGMTFYPWCVGGADEQKAISSDLGHQGETGQYYTLGTIMKRLGHTMVDLLKMDIERHEFAVVQALEFESAPMQIVFETHLHNAYGMWGGPVQEREWMVLWERLYEMGYGVFTHEPNPQCISCCEFSILRQQEPPVKTLTQVEFTSWAQVDQTRDLRNTIALLYITILLTMLY